MKWTETFYEYKQCIITHVINNECIRNLLERGGRLKWNDNFKRRTREASTFLQHEGKPSPTIETTCLL